jgi:hypothetical protein
MTITTESFTYWADSRDRQAAVALLLWLGKSIPTVKAWTDEPGQVGIDVEQLAYVSGAWSGGERRLTAVALSLLGHEPCNLSDVFGGLGGQHLKAVVQAIVHAAGIGPTNGPLGDLG